MSKTKRSPHKREKRPSREAAFFQAVDRGHVFGHWRLGKFVGPDRRGHNQADSGEVCERWIPRYKHPQAGEGDIYCPCPKCAEVLGK